MEKSDAMRIKTSLRASLSLSLSYSLSLARSLAPFNRGRKGTRFFVKTSGRQFSRWGVFVKSREWREFLRSVWRGGQGGWSRLFSFVTGQQKKKRDKKDGYQTLPSLLFAQKKDAFTQSFSSSHSRDDVEERV